MCVVAIHIFHQRGHISGDAEQDGPAIMKLHIDVAEHACPFPIAAGQIH